MPICRKRKLAFIHVPKTAGESLLEYFEIKKIRKNYYGPLANYTICLQHLNLQEMHDFINLDNFFKFAFVRNPWDRLVSKFHFDIEKHPNSPKPFPLKHNFTDYVLALKENFERVITNNPNHWMCCHFLTQSSYVKSKEIKLDFLGRFENLKNDIKIIAEKFNIKKDFPHNNKTNHKPFESYYNTKTKDIVSSLYKEDIKNFGYTFDKKKYLFKDLI